MNIRVLIRLLLFFFWK